MPGCFTTKGNISPFPNSHHITPTSTTTGWGGGHKKSPPAAAGLSGALEQEKSIINDPVDPDDCDGIAFISGR